MPAPRLTDPGPAVATPGEAAVAWRELGACRLAGVPTTIFFSEDPGEIAAAKRICARCPVLAPCLEQALARREPCGVWGGQLFADGRVIAVKRRRGRPPKVPRPSEQLPVVPIPDHLADLVRSA